MTISGRMFGTASSLIAVFMLGLCNSSAIELKNASYFCNVEFVGGLRFNKSLKQWESAEFQPHRKFVLKLEFVAKRIQKNFQGEDEPVADFKVTLTEGGTNDVSPCFSKDYGMTVLMGTYNYLDCVSSSLEHQFNLKTNRFLAYYKYGYLDGEDNNDDTPRIWLALPAMKTNTRSNYPAACSSAQQLRAPSSTIRN